MYAHNDPMAAGAYLAAKAKGRDKEMKFIGVDGLPGLDGGRPAVEIAATILAGEKVPKKIALPTEPITRGGTR